MFQVGDKVFYPMHGAGIIKAIEEKEVLGKVQQYLLISIPTINMDISIPKQRAEKVGIRPLTDRETLKAILSDVHNNNLITDLPWKERLKQNTNKLKTGEIHETADAFKDLFYRNKEKPLNTSEKELLNDAQKFLVSEICMIKEISEDEAIDLLVV